MRGSNITLVDYGRLEIQISDHRPVHGTFSVKTKAVDKELFNQVMDSAVDSANKFMKSQSREFFILWTALLANTTIEEAVSILSSSNWDLSNVLKFLGNK
jgi:hypothetical protein